MSQITLLPCPFCKGPPAVLVAKALAPYGAAPEQPDYGCSGLDINAYVFCHECGCTGPMHEDVIFSAEDYATAKNAGVQFWQERTAKHSSLYDANGALNLYPREARP